MPVLIVPDFMEWIVVGFDGWQLKDDAPEQVKQAYREFEKRLELAEEAE